MNAGITTQAVVETLNYVNEFHGKRILIKVGGSILDNVESVRSLSEDIKLIKGVGIDVVLVHGGGKAINEALQINNIQSEFVDGLRVTSRPAMNAIEMVLCGQVNKQLVRQLNNVGVKAIGLSGTDNNMLPCKPFSKQHGAVGLLTSVHTADIIDVINKNCVPVISPIGVNELGQAMNINADIAACEIAKALKVDKCIYLTDTNGIYNEEKAVYSKLQELELNQLIESKTVQGGMLIKVQAILAALQTDLSEVHILNGNRAHALLEELFTRRGVGTLCQSMQKLPENIGETL